MDHQQLLAWTLDDLAHRSQGITEYDALVSAALLRKLLLDGPGLMNRANATGRALEFNVVREHLDKARKVMSDDAPPFFTGAWLDRYGMLPESGTGTPENLKLQSFLQHPVALARGSRTRIPETVTVRDLIKYLANTAGGVHKGNPKSGKELLLHSLSDELFQSGRAAVSTTVQSIALITLRCGAPVVRHSLEQQSILDVVVPWDQPGWGDFPRDGRTHLVMLDTEMTEMHLLYQPPRD